MRHGVKGPVLLLGAAVIAATGGATRAAPAHSTVATSAIVRSTVVGQVRIWKIAYRAHNGARRNAFVALPRSYRPGQSPPIPLVISPHGRGVSGRANVKLWGQLPAVGDFAVISPDGQGRILDNYSWGSSGQIADLARMPQIVHLTLPWIHIDPRRVYAVGGSMGGQETLLLIARYPRLLAGAAAFDPVVNFKLQYKEFPHLQCSKTCRTLWGGTIGRSLQALAREELGGSPTRNPEAFRLRSPITYARALAFSHVPLQIWWSPKDRIVIDQQRQAARLVHEIRRLNPSADLVGLTGGWRHSAEMRSRTRLPVALAIFGLLPEGYGRLDGLHVIGQAPLRAAPGKAPLPKRELL
jgi:pimeloyl-ACP methyl ester carboxylesterase